MILERRIELETEIEGLRFILQYCPTEDGCASNVDLCVEAFGRDDKVLWPTLSPELKLELAELIESEVGRDEIELQYDEWWREFQDEQNRSRAV